MQGLGFRAFCSGPKPSSTIIKPQSLPVGNPGLQVSASLAQAFSKDSYVVRVRRCEIQRGGL